MSSVASSTSGRKSAYDELIHYLALEDGGGGVGGGDLDDGLDSAPPILSYNSSFSGRRVLLDCDVGRLGPIDRGFGSNSNSSSIRLSDNYSSSIHSNNINNNSSNNHINNHINRGVNSSIHINHNNNSSSSMNASSSNISFANRGSITETNLLSTSLVIDSSRKKYADVKLEIDNFIDQLEAYKSFRLHQMREFKKLHEIGLDEATYFDSANDDVDGDDGDDDDDMEVSKLVQALTKKGKLKEFESKTRFILRTNKDTVVADTSVAAKEPRNGDDYDDASMLATATATASHSINHLGGVQKGKGKGKENGGKEYNAKDATPFAMWLMSAIEKTDSRKTAHSHSHSERIRDESSSSRIGSASSIDGGDRVLSEVLGF